jgi:membrane fusion protein, adhesin transport system
MFPKFNPKAVPHKFFRLPSWVRNLSAKIKSWILRISPIKFTITQLMAIFFVVLILLSIVFTVDQSVTCQGAVTSVSKAQIVQAVDGGVVAGILVKEGDEVAEGQPLAQLDTSRSAAAYDESSTKLMSLKAAQVRAIAEANFRTPNFDDSFDKYPDFKSAQLNLFKQRKKSLNEDLSVLDNMLNLAGEEFSINEKLYLSGDISRIEVMRAKRQLAEVQARIFAVKNKYIQDAAYEATKLEDEMASQKYRVIDRKDVLDHLSLKSPVSGVVKVIKTRTIGGVLRPGEEVMEIATSDGGYEIDLKVNPADIAHLKIGLPATVRIDAFDPSTYGSLEGIVTYVGPDTLVEQSPLGQSATYYRARVRLKSAQSNNPKVGLLAVRLGMQATAYIKTGNRSLFKYMFKSFYRVFDGALSEK